MEFEGVLGLGPELSPSAAGAGSRAVAIASVRAARALGALDALRADRALDAVVAVHERPRALAAALRERHVVIDSAAIVRRWLGLPQGPDPEFAMSDVTALDRRWRGVGDRSNTGHVLRRLVRSLTPGRVPDFAAIGAATFAAVGKVRSPPGLDDLVHGRTGRSGDGAPETDLADLMMALPYVWRRCGLTRRPLAGVMARPRLLFAPHTDDPPEITPAAPPALAAWIDAVAAAADESGARVRRVQRYLADAEARIALAPHAGPLRRVVAVALVTPLLWPQRLAEIDGTDPTTAWRVLRRAAGLGLIGRVPGTGLGGGEGYAHAVWLDAAGVHVRRRPPGWPPEPASRPDIVVLAADFAHGAPR